MMFRTLAAFAALVAYAAAVPAHSLAWHALHDVTRTVLKEGKGPKPSHFHLVTVSYKGTLKNGKEHGKVFESSKSYSFVLGKGDVIDCWDQGVAQMHVGETAKLSCPSGTAYGQFGRAGLVPPNADLDFEVELYSFKKASAAEAAQATEQ